MRRKSPLSLDRIQIYVYDNNRTDELVFIEQFPYDERNDFVVDRSFNGIAVKLEFSNMRYDRGVRRSVSIRLVDVTARYEVASQSEQVIIRKDEFIKEIYVYLSTEVAEINPGHTYKLVVRDVSASQTLSERVFHLFDKDRLPHPSEWYEICDGGIRPPWEWGLYKTVKTLDNQEYYVRFNFAQKFGDMLPDTLPELELRLYYPDGRRFESHFREPVRDAKGCDSNTWLVECPFTTSCGDNGVFYAELLCMEYPIAGFAFDTDVDDERGSWFGPYVEPLEEYSPEAAAERWACSPARTDESTIAEELDFDQLLDKFISDEMAQTDSEADNEVAQEPDTENQSESLLSSLNHLTGLRAVKEKLTVYERVVRFNKMRSDKGLSTTSSPLHAMFLGSPGTGKTTVAKMMGSMLHRAGMLSKGHVVVRERATLLGQNYNSEAEKTLAAIEDAQGGILFIDEAYQLYQPNDSRDPGKFVIETLLTALADETNRDWMLVLAGYPDEMRRMFEMNPGFKSRIPESNIYLFDDFTDSELFEIADRYLSRNQYHMTDEARSALTDRLRKDYANRKKNFGNARHVINMIQTEIIPSMAVRVTSARVFDEKALTEIIAADIPRISESPADAPRSRVGFL